MVHHRLASHPSRKTPFDSKPTLSPSARVPPASSVFVETYGSELGALTADDITDIVKLEFGPGGAQGPLWVGVGGWVRASV